MASEEYSNVYFVSGISDSLMMKAQSENDSRCIVFIEKECSEIDFLSWTWSKKTNQIYTSWTFSRVQDRILDQSSHTNLEIINIVKQFYNTKINISNNLNNELLNEFIKSKYKIGYFFHGFGDLYIMKNMAPILSELFIFISDILRLKSSIVSIRKLRKMITTYYSSMKINRLHQKLMIINKENILESYSDLHIFLVNKLLEYNNFMCEVSNQKKKNTTILLIDIEAPSFNISNNVEYLQTIKNSMLGLNLKNLYIIFKLRPNTIDRSLTDNFINLLKKKFTGFNYYILGYENMLNSYPLEFYACVCKIDHIITGSHSVLMNLRNTSSSSVLFINEKLSKFKLRDHYYSNKWRIEKKYYKKLSKVFI